MKTPTVDMDDIDLDDPDLFDVVAIMDAEEEKQEMEDMLKEMEKAAEEKRIAMERKRKEKEEEERKRKQWAEEARRKKEIEEQKLAEQQAEIDEKAKQVEAEKTAWNKEQNMRKLKELQESIKRIGQKDSDDEDSDSDVVRDGDEDDDNYSSTDSDWESSSDDGIVTATTTIIEEENTCMKFFPFLKCCICCAKKKIHRPPPRKGEEKEKDITKQIVSTKRRLSKFLYKYGDDYVDDDTMVLSQDRLTKLTKDVNMNDKMGIYFWSLVLDKQSQKTYDCLWPVLRYLGQELPTPVAVELMQLYRVELSRYPPNKIEGIAKAIVESSSFAIATALVFASYFMERAQKDLANTRLYDSYSEKYQNWAADELRTVESDYLASMVMMTKSFHNFKTPFSIAVDNELIDFLSSDRMARIGHAIWVKRDLLKPEISENSFEVRSTGLLAVVKALPNPREFYFTPMGFNFTEKFLFIGYLLFFTAVTIMYRRKDDGSLGPMQVSDELITVDWILFVCSFGYIFNEILQFIQEGATKYFQTWENAVDIMVSVIWILIMFLRILAVLLIDSIDRYLDGGIQDIELISGIKEPDSFLNLLFTALWVINIILLWIRCLHFLMLSNQEGPLINVTKSMAGDVKNWLWVFLVISAGFLFGMYFLVGDSNPFFETTTRSLSLTILAAFGQPNWVHVQSSDIEVLNTINSWLVVVYSVVGFVLLVNLLIAMMAESYSRTEGQSAKEVLLNKTSLAFELDTSPKIMPPPLNSILFVCFVLYNIVDILVLAITAEFLNEQGWRKFWRCKNKECRFLNPKSVIDKYIKQGWEKDFPCGLCDYIHTMDEVFKGSKRRFRRKARGLEGTKSNFCSRLGHGFKEIFVTKTKWKKHSWSCGYCRSRIPANYSADLERYFSRLRETHNLDQNDVNWIKSMNPQLCPYCYRPRRPRARPTYILENVSFLIYLSLIWPIMWLCLWPLFLYDAIKNPERAERDYKDFRKKHNKLYSLRPDASTVRKHMPRSHLHQTLISLHHPIWRSLHKHRSTVKGQTLAQSIHSANLRQERVRGQNEQDKRGKVAKISHLVMEVVSSMANHRVQWQPTGVELMERMSAISGVDIDSNWYDKHRTHRAEKLKKDKLLLMFEAAGGKNMNAKSAAKLNAMSQRHLRGGSKSGMSGFPSMMDDIDLDALNVIDDGNKSRRSTAGGGSKRSSVKLSPPTTSSRPSYKQ